MLPYKVVVYPLKDGKVDTATWLVLWEFASRLVAEKWVKEFNLRFQKITCEAVLEVL